MTRQPPNRRLVQAAHQLDAYLARQVTDALEHIRLELTIADSYPTQTPGASIAEATGSAPVCRCDGSGCDVCMPVTLTSTERGADAMWRLKANREQIRDDIAAIESLIQSLTVVCRKTLGERVVAVDRPRRCDATGQDGAIEWWEPCDDLPDKAGLCGRHYMARRRWRIREGLPTRDEAA